MHNLSTILAWFYPTPLPRVPVILPYDYQDLYLRTRVDAIYFEPVSIELSKGEFFPRGVKHAQNAYRPIIVIVQILLLYARGLTKSCDPDKIG